MLYVLNNAGGKNSFPDSVREIRHCSTGLLLNTNLFAKSKYSEDVFAAGLQIISQSLMSLTLGQIFRFYWETFLNVCIVLLSQEFIRFISVGQVQICLSFIIELSLCPKYYPIFLFLPQPSSHPENIRRRLSCLRLFGSLFCFLFISSRN